MHLVGYFASLLIGVSLGLIGGGGSILTLPVMVYFFGVSPVTATSYSLFIVGSTSLVGAAQQYRQGAVNIKLALLFSLTSVVTVFATRRWLIPAIPEHLAYIGPFELTESWLMMVTFAVLMLASAILMVRRDKHAIQPVENNTSAPLGKLAILGTGIGLLTGLLGAGGGFLLIPALVLLLHMPMKEAVGTSLLVIALNSLIGFSGNMQQESLDWPLLLKVSLLAITGILAGSYLSKRIAANGLKKGFGWFVLIMGCYILYREFSAAAGLLR